MTDAATGLPLAGVFVEAYGAAGTFPPDGFDTTDASGLYSIQGLAPGSYFMLTLNDQGYTDELHLGIPCNGRTCDITTGHAVTLLAGATIGGLNFELDAGNQVLGTVTNLDTMAPAANVFVDIYDDSASLVTFGTTAADGTYRTFGGLADGDFFALTNNGVGLLDELYDDFPDPGPGCSLLQGTAFVLPGASSIDFGLSSNPPSTWTITDCTIDETRVFEAQSNVTAGGAAGFVIAASGNVTFRSGERIVLTNGFSVADGATFTAEIDPSLKP